MTANWKRALLLRMCVGYIPGFPGANSQSGSLDELSGNLREVIELLLEDGEPFFEAELVGAQLVTAA